MPKLYSDRRIFAFSMFFYAGFVCAQTTSNGPGKGPPAPGQGFKQTYPQPKKATAAGPERIDPSTEVPDHPEKAIWKLSNKKFPPGANPDDVPVYSFGGLFGRRTLVGQAKVGDEITLEEVRLAMGRNHFKFKWSGAPPQNPNIPVQPEYWIDGINIEYSGKR
jgi:hypothetical protein